MAGDAPGRRIKRINCFVRVTVAAVYFPEQFCLTLLLVSGTKWCGTGDIADNYHDLGRDAKIDR